MLTRSSATMPAKGKVPEFTYDIVGFRFVRDCGHRHNSATYTDFDRKKFIKEGIKNVPLTLDEYVLGAEQWCKENTLCDVCVRSHMRVRRSGVVEVVEEIGVD